MGLLLLEKIQSMPKEKVLTDVRDVIMDKMKQEGRVLTWLAEKTGISYDTLYPCLKKKLFSLSEENLEKINDALKTSFE